MSVHSQRLGQTPQFRGFYPGPICRGKAVQRGEIRLALNPALQEAGSMEIAATGAARPASASTSAWVD